MKLLLTAILFSLGFYACQTGPRKGVVTQIDATNIDKFCVLHDVSTTREGFQLKDESAAIVSKFKVRNFEFTAKLKTTAGAAGELVFAAPDTGGAKDGYVVKINNSDYRIGNLQKTGSLSGIRNNFVRTANDNDWFNLAVSVHGNRITVAVNDEPIVDYTEPAIVVRSEVLKTRKLATGSLMIRKSSTAGEILIGEISITPLSNNLKEVNLTTAEPDSLTKMVDLLNEQEFPLIDFHAHLKGGLTMKQAYEHAQKYGYNYGIAANCGLKFPVTNDSTLNAYFDGIRKEPVFKAMQCEGREWVTLFSPKAVARFDYIFTDAMTWTDLKGHRMRLWIPEETFIADKQKFMDLLVSKIEAILGHEPVDIHANPTYLPAQLAADYDRLWTPERMDRVIKALKDNDVALEINARFKIPSITFIKRAKAAGVKFSFGTNNGSNNDLGRLEYCLKAIKEAGLTREDMFIPRPANEKKVMKSGLPSKITG